MKNNCVITGSGVYTPEQTITNEELVKSFNQYIDENFKEEERKSLYSNVEFIEKASGIKSRHTLDKRGILDTKRMKAILPNRKDDELCLQAEYSVKAAEVALKQANREGKDVDCIILSCSNLQRPYPNLAIEVQKALGAKGFAYDMSLACSSATFAITNAIGLIETSHAKCALIVSPEIAGSQIDYTDRDSHFIFGDAATAVLVESKDTAQVKEGFEVIDAHLHTDFSNNIRTNFGFLNRVEEGGRERKDLLFKQNGRKVFKEVCSMVPVHVKAQLKRLDIPPHKLKRLWLHQANLSMNEFIARKILGVEEINRDQVPIILDTFANTASAGSIIAFNLHQHGVDVGDLAMLCSFGAGYSMGSLVLKKVSIS